MNRLIYVLIPLMFIFSSSVSAEWCNCWCSPIGGSCCNWCTPPDATSVSEPGTFMLLLAGIAGVIAVKLVKRKNSKK